MLVQPQLLELIQISKEGSVHISNTCGTGMLEKDPATVSMGTENLGFFIVIY